MLKRKDGHKIVVLENSRAVRDGVSRDGHHLYPAFPYDHMTRMTDADIKAVYAVTSDGTIAYAGGVQARQWKWFPGMVGLVVVIQSPSPWSNAY